GPRTGIRLPGLAAVGPLGVPAADLGQLPAHARDVRTRHQSFRGRTFQVAGGAAAVRAVPARLRLVLGAPRGLRLVFLPGGPAGRRAAPLRPLPQPDRRPAPALHHRLCHGRALPAAGLHAGSGGTPAGLPVRHAGHGKGIVVHPPRKFCRRPAAGTAALRKLRRVVRGGGAGVQVPLLRAVAGAVRRGL
ncbi:MAG: hypothetical protein AVDCRST_MAG56-7153, partial [uncultured Cytophagales bacterium]